MAKVELTCENCGTVYERHPFDAKRSKKHFCSKGCESLWRKGRNMLDLTCEACGKEFQRQQSSLKKHTFCSKECTDRWRKESKLFVGKDNPNWKERVSLICCTCGKSFERLACNIASERNFCSKVCHVEWQRTIRGAEHPLYKRVVVQCEICGIEYETIPAKAERRFCSQECNNVWFGRWAATERIQGKHPNWKGGAVNYRGPNWKRQSLKARQRDNFTCQRCGAHLPEGGKALPVHHIVPFRAFGVDRYKEANDLSNLISLCVSCHSIVEWETNRNEDHNVGSTEVASYQLGMAFLDELEYQQKDA